MKQLRFAALCTAAVLLAGCGGGTPMPGAAPSQFITGIPAATNNSVVRLTGNADSCNQHHHGTGFVVAEDLVITNAHNVAGVSDVGIDGPATPKMIYGKVVYFDPNIDLALIRVPDLNLPALTIGDNLEAGAESQLLGYPDGDSQQEFNVTIVRTFTATTYDIYNTVKLTHEIAEGGLVVLHGDSGGPLIDSEGVVHGIVFARAPDKVNVGYFLLPEAINYVISQGGSATEALTTKCTINN